MIIGEMKVMVNETSQYNIGLPKEIEYEKVIGKVVSKLKGIDAYAKTTAGYGKTPVNSSANHIYVTQYGKVDNTSKLKSILKKADPNLDVSKLKNNFNASDSARSKHDQDNDIWKYSIPKKMDWHQAKKAGILKTKPIKKMSHDVVIDLLDMMAPYTSKQHELADQEWTSLDSFMQHASDLISGSNWKKFQQSVKKKYPVLESVSEATIMTRAQTIWKDLKKYPIQKPTSGMANKADFAALIHFSGQTWAKNVAGGKWIRTDIKNPNFPNKNPNIISSNDLDKKLRTQNKVQIKEGKLTKESVNEAKNFFPDEIVVLKKVKYNGVWLLPGTYEDVQEEDFGQRVYRNIKTKKEVYLDYDDIDNMRRLKSNIQIKESVNEARWTKGEKITITTKRGETYTGTVEVASPLVLRTGPKENDIIMKFGRDVKKVVKESVNEGPDHTSGLTIKGRGFDWKKEDKQAAYTLHRLANNVGSGKAEEFLSKHNIDLKLLAKAISQKTIDKYTLRDIVNGKAHKYDVKKFMKQFVKESVNEAKKYKKGDKLKIKLKNGKQFDLTFDSYSRQKGMAFGKFKDKDGEFDKKPFSLDTISESIDEAKKKIKPGTEIRWPSNHKNKSLAGRSGYVAKIKGSNALMNMHDNSNNKAMWIPVPIKDLPKAKESVNGDFPKQYAKAFAKATGNESVNEADLKLDYCGKCMQMTNQKDKKCQKCKKKNESVNEGTSWPKEVEAYDPDVIFKLVKDMGGKAKYDIVLKKNGKVIEPGGRVYKSLKSLEAEAGDYTRSKGGTQSSQFGESVSEGSESMEEDHIKINKDEMDTLHSTGKLDKDGHVIEYDDSLEEHVLRKLVNEELDNMFNEIQYRPQSGTKAGAIHSLPKKKYQLKKNTLVQLVNKQYVTLPKGTVISNLPGGLFAKHGTLKKFYKDAKDQKWGIMIVSREQTLQAIEDNSKVLESVNEAKNPFKKGNKVVVDKIVGMTHSRQSDAKRFNGKKGIVNSTQGDYVSVKLKGFRSSDIEFHMKELKLVESVNEAANPLMKSKEGLKTWWKHSKEDIMSFVYWTQKKMPPSNKSSYDKQWKLIVKQLHGKSPAPVSDYKKKMREKIVFYKDDDKKLRRFDTDQSKNT
jgi:ribosomal protein L21E